MADKELDTNAGRTEETEDGVLKKVEKRKKARLRTRGPYRKANIPH